MSNRFLKFLRIALARMACVALAFGVAFGPMQAQTSSQAINLDEISQLRLAYGWTRNDGAHVAAVVVDLAPGWKTYWRAADSNGLPPSFDWRGSDNANSVQYLWPTPQVFTSAATRTIGFEHQLVLPIVVRPKDRDDTLSLDLVMDYGVCSQICIPARGAASLDLANALPERELIELALLARPETGTDRGLRKATCGISPQGEDYELAADLSFADPLGQVDAVMIEAGDERIWVSEPDIAASANSVSLTADVYYFGDGAMALDRSAMRFTLLTSTGGVEVAGCTGG